MVIENYSFAFPLDHSQCLKVTIQVLEKQIMSLENSAQPYRLVSRNSTEKNEIEISGLHELPGNIVQAINTAHRASGNRTAMPQSFLASTATGYQLLRLNQIVYFEYLTDKKTWIVLLTDQTQLSLKRNTVAETILSYSPDFIRINQQHIINLNYLVRIEDKSCQLSAHIDTKNRLIISRNYMKGLQERVGVI